MRHLTLNDTEKSILYEGKKHNLGNILRHFYVYRFSIFIENVSKYFINIIFRFSN